MKRYLALFAFFFLSATLIFAQDCPPGEVEISIHIDQDLLTIYIPEGTASLRGLNFATIFEGVDARFFLDNYAEFAALNLDALQGPHCLSLRVEGTDPQLPDDCATADLAFHDVSADQNFWYNAALDRWPSLTIKQFAYDLDVCASAMCSVRVPPLAVPVSSLELCGNSLLCELFLDPAQIEGAQKFDFTGEGGQLDARLTPECAFWGDYGLSMTYDMPQNGFGGWGVQWLFTDAGSYDASAQSFITFWMRADSDTDAQLGIKDFTGFEEKVNLSDWIQLEADNWSFFRVPLSRFANAGIDLAHLENISFGFNQDHGRGAVCVDNISFLQEASTVEIDEPINARLEPYTNCGVLDQLEAGETLYIAARVPGTQVAGSSNWVLAVHEERYVYIHSLFVNPVTPSAITETPVATPSPTASPEPETLVIADFDNGTNINNLGQEMGAFYPTDAGDQVTPVYENGQVTVSYTLATNSFGGFWMRLGGADFTPYQQLSFDIAATDSFSMKVELKGSDNVPAPVSFNVSPSTQTITIPLSQFSVADFSNMSELVFVLEQANVVSAGSITIDNVRVTSATATTGQEATTSNGSLVVADFDNGTNINNLGQEMGAFYPTDAGDQVTPVYENGQVTVSYTLATNSFGGFWMRLGGADFTPYQQLSFDIAATGSFSMKVELKGSDNVPAYRYFPVSPSMQTITIPLTDFNIADFSNMSELVFVLEQATVGSTGSITIDNIILQ